MDPWSWINTNVANDTYPLAELGALGKFRVEMERLLVMRKRPEDQIVRFRDRARDRMLEDMADLKFLKI
jgi:hypothetical protein